MLLTIVSQSSIHNDFDVSELHAFLSLGLNMPLIAHKPIISDKIKYKKIVNVGAASSCITSVI